MIYQRLLEQRRRLTPGERAAFVRQIRDLVSDTANLEREKVDAAVGLLQDALADVRTRLLRLRPGTFSRQTGNQVKDALKGQLQDFEKAAKALFRDAQPEFGRLGLRAMQELIGTQGFTPGKIGLSKELILNATTRSADLITSLAADEIGAASDIINRGVLTGRSVFEVARELSGEFDKGLSRMETIARTEMLMVYSQAQQSQLNDMAQDTKGLRKQWVAVMDDRTRLGHRKAHLQSVPWDEPFKVRLSIRRKGEEVLGEVEELQFPRDPAGSPSNIIACRCAHIPDFSRAEPIPEPGLEEEEMPPIQAPLLGLGAKVAKELRRAA